MRGAWLIVAVAACNPLFGLDETVPLPVDDLDADDDGIDDLVDNCRDVANPGQADDDVDGLGNGCDNCPLVPNTAQDDFDGDLVGDGCDSHPANVGDCLLVFDSFEDPDGFAAHWQTLATATNAVVTPEAGRVVVMPEEGDSITLIAVDDGGVPLAGTFDVQLAGELSIVSATARLGVVASRSATDRYECSLRPASGVMWVDTSVQTANVSLSDQRALSSLPIGTRAFLRFVTLAADGKTVPRCRIDYGVAVGVSGFVTEQTAFAASSVGLVVGSQQAAIDGIAIYRYQPGQACPVPVVR